MGPVAAVVAAAVVAAAVVAAAVAAAVATAAPLHLVRSIAVFLLLLRVSTIRGVDVLRIHTNHFDHLASVQYSSSWESRHTAMPLAELGAVQVTGRVLRV